MAVTRAATRLRLLLGLLLTLHAVGAVADITPALLQARIATLSNKAVGLRRAGTEGEDRTVEALIAQFKALGLYPGSLNGQWTQTVDLMGIQSEGHGTFSIGTHNIVMHPLQDYVLGSRRYQPDLDVQDAPLLFAGYGRHHPDSGFDDFRHADVAGKVLLLLADPAPNGGAFSPNSADLPDSKFALAARLGAAAVLLIHGDSPALPGWPQLQQDATGEVFDLDADDRNLSRVAMQGWITAEKARELLHAAGQDFDALRKQAAAASFEAVPLPVNANLHVSNTLRSIESRNVIARLAGSDPQLETQHILYATHWDQRTASDSGNGLAALLAMAQAFRQAPTPPRRSVLFMALVAGSENALGARWYSQHPLFSPRDTLAALNLDAPPPQVAKPTLEIIGSGQNSLEDLATAIADRHHLRLKPGTHPKRGDFYHGKSLAFAQIGIPVLTLREPAPESDPDLSAASSRLQILLELGQQLAGQGAWPMWKPGSEFKAIREKPLE